MFEVRSRRSQKLEIGSWNWMLEIGGWKFDSKTQDFELKYKFSGGVKIQQARNSVAREIQWCDTGLKTRPLHCDCIFAKR
jgi:hypothetical protein